MSHRIDVDLILLGGGIAGLWLMNRLGRLGYRVLLLESEAVGGRQTLASQGMIHGGLKYALGGLLTREAEAIARMPTRWQRCLDGAADADIDLSGVPLLSRHFHLWSAGGLGSRLTSFFASKSLRGQVTPVTGSDRPAVLQHPDFQGRVYRLTDVVLDVPALIQRLAAPWQDRLVHAKPTAIDWHREDNRVTGLTLTQRDGTAWTIQAQAVIAAAGAGNADILAALDQSAPAMQRRPLHQVIVTHDRPEWTLYGHVMGAGTRASPRLTVSTHADAEGRSLWYLGGDLATDGVSRTPEAQIAMARRELADLFPWLDFRDAGFSTLLVDRAEPRQPGLTKPDEAFADTGPGLTNLIVAWPTKLTLTPDLGDRVLDRLRSLGVTPSGTDDRALPELPRPPFASPAWETAS